jgi:hypothetical protein
MKTCHLLLAVLAPALAIYALIAAEPDQGLVAHEWGTFTSVQAADGVPMFWNPPASTDLPGFVYERNQVISNGNALRNFKTGMLTLQRMETPVIYFYSDRERTVDVSVQFPQGVVTEWYPLKTAANLSPVPLVGPNAQPALHWEQVQILPKATDLKLPQDSSGSHYYSARATDAALLRVPTGEQKSEVEKFLFYRGTANFAAPLTVRLDPADPKRVLLVNTGAEELRNLFVYEVGEGDTGLWLSVDQLNPGETRAVRLDLNDGAQPLTAADRSIDKAALVSSPRLGSALVSGLIREGLYAKEATAMVKTWEASWFAEKGTRVLYTLPRAWTDRTLPLKITPAPQATARVMIGRAEVITPAREQALLAQVERYQAASEKDLPGIVEATRALGLGRFIQPTMNRLVQGKTRTTEFTTRAWELVNAVTRLEQTQPRNAKATVSSQPVPATAAN